MSNYHKRIFCLDYMEETLPRFETQEEIDEFHRLLGRTVMYGLQRDAEEDKLDMVTAALTKNPVEVCAAYWRAVPRYGRWEDGSIKVLGSLDAQVGGAQVAVQEASQAHGRPFVMALAQHCDNSFGLHS